jgi:hypothetical protein
MSETFLSPAFGRIVHRRYESLTARNVNPTLAAIQNELQMLDGVRMSEEEISEHLAGLDCGPRGHTGKGDDAASATRRAALASAHAEKVNTPDAHFDARLAHSAAACAHRTAAEYHNAQEKHHADAEKAKPKTDTGADESGETPVESSRASHPLMCARALPSMLGDATVPTSLLYMPSGLHRITPSQGGKPVTVTVGVNQDSAAQLERQRQILAASGNKPFFSVQHNTQIAAFWPSRFCWDRRRAPDGQMVTGVWADGEWSNAGREAVEGKNFRSFSPTFFVDKVSNDEDDPAQVECSPGAPLNMGALENDPAFAGAMPPLWPDNHPRA